MLSLSIFYFEGDFDASTFKYTWRNLVKLLTSKLFYRVKQIFTL